MPPMEAELAPGSRTRPLPGHVPGCDFFCLRFGVWYASIDCAYRTRFRSYDGCADCDQGRFNLKRHAASLEARRWLPVVAPGRE